MTDQVEPGCPPAHDLSAFDLTKRSPEQLARSFARWKAQRKRPPAAAHASQPLPAQPSTAVEQDAALDPSPTPSKRAKPEYSATFSALLAAGSEPTVQRAAWTPIGERRSPKRSRSPGRRLKAMSILAGAASVLALAGGALLELSDWRASTEAEPQVAQVQPQQIPMAGPIAAAATRAPSVEWKLQQIVDLALMKAAHDGAAAKPMQPTPEPPMVRTASKAAIAAPPGPAPKKTVPETEQFVAKPFVPSAAPAPAVVPAAQGTAAIPAPPVAAAIHSGDPRPDALFQHRREKSTGTASIRVAPGAKPAAAFGSESAVATTRTGTARSGTVANGGNSDPRGELSGGASVGPDATNANGGGAGDASAGSDTGSGNTGDDGAADDGSASSDAGGGTGGADTGAAAGSDTSGGAAGDDAGDASGSGDPGDGASGEGDSGSSDGEEGDSGGIGGAISGALDGVGDALSGALGGNGNPDSEDKDQKD